MNKANLDVEQRQITVKLERVAKLLDEVLEELDERNIPISPSLQKKLVARWKAIDSGKVKLHHYKSLAAFDRALG
jgi:hypothetical protein